MHLQLSLCCHIKEKKKGKEKAEKGKAYSYSFQYTCRVHLGLFVKASKQKKKSTFVLCCKLREDPVKESTVMKDFQSV